MSGSPTEVTETVRHVLESRADVRLALLFGSAARGGLGPHSDVDVGFVPVDPDMDLATELDLQAALERTVGRTVDLVRLDRADVLLRWRVARDGVLLSQTGPHEASRFRARAAIVHDELRWVLDRATSAYRQRLAQQDPPESSP